MQNGRQSIWKVCEIHFFNVGLVFVNSFVLRDESCLQACHIAVKTSKKREIEEGDQCEISSSHGGEYDVQSCLLGYTAG
jgi:hypothetical protein